MARHSWTKFSFIATALLASTSCQYGSGEVDAEDPSAPESVGEAKEAVIVTLFRLELGGVIAGSANSYDNVPANVAHVSMKGVPSASLTSYVQSMLSSAAPATRNGALVTSNGTEDQRRLDFTNAYITQLDFPALSSSVQTTGAIGLTLSPDAIVLSGTNTPTPRGGPTVKSWLTSTFQVTIPNMDTSSVTQVGATTFRRPLTNRVPGPLQVPNLALTISESGVASFVQWYTDFVINGHSGEANKRPVTIAILTPDRVSTLFKFSFAACGISALVQNSGSRTAQLFCETVSFSVP